MFISHSNTNHILYSSGYVVLYNDGADYTLTYSKVYALIISKNVVVEEDIS